MSRSKGLWRRFETNQSPGYEPLRVAADICDSLDDDQEYRGRLVLLGKGALLAHRLARPLAAESDEYQKCRDASCVHGSVTSAPSPADT